MIVEAVLIDPRFSPLPWWRSAWDWLLSPWRGSRLQRFVRGGRFVLKVGGQYVVNAPLSVCTLERGLLRLAMDPPLVLESGSEVALAVTFDRPERFSDCTPAAQLLGQCMTASCDHVDQFPVSQDPDCYEPRAVMWLCPECGRLEARVRPEYGGRTFLYWQQFPMEGP